MRRKRAAEGRKDLTADDIVAIMDKCKPSMKAITLLGINAGIGNQDIADIEFQHWAI